MTLPPRITFVTLACRDIERMAQFFRALGWPEAPSSEAAHRVFQCSNGVVLGLYAAENYERVLGPWWMAFAASRWRSTLGPPPR